MRVSFLRCALTLVGLSTVTVSSASYARAERIISDLEASKLTFASLTAAPPIVHIHHTVHTGRHATVVAQNKTAHGMVHLVSYRPKHAVSHTAKRHRT